MAVNPLYSIQPLGDSGITISFGNNIDSATNDFVIALFHRLKSTPLPFILDIIPTYSSLSVIYNMPLLLNEIQHKKYAFDFMQEWLKNETGQVVMAKERHSKTIRVPVCYAEDYAPDIKELATKKALSIEDVIRIHTGIKYKVYMIGFLPGFAYMGEVDQLISIDRKEQPHNRIEAGSVGIAGRQTGIYPLHSPGGWQIIGRTPLKLFNKKEIDPVYFKPGDEVIFYSITEDEFKDY